MERSRSFFWNQRSPMQRCGAIWQVWRFCTILGAKFRISNDPCWIQPAAWAAERWRLVFVPRQFSSYLPFFEKGSKLKMQAHIFLQSNSDASNLYLYQYIYIYIFAKTYFDYLPRDSKPFHDLFVQNSETNLVKLLDLWRPSLKRSLFKAKLKWSRIGFQSAGRLILKKGGLGGIMKADFFRDHQWWFHRASRIFVCHSGSP